MPNASAAWVKTGYYTQSPAAEQCAREKVSGVKRFKVFTGYAGMEVLVSAIRAARGCQDL